MHHEPCMMGDATFTALETALRIFAIGLAAAGFGCGGAKSSALTTPDGGGAGGGAPLDGSGDGRAPDGGAGDLAGASDASPVTQQYRACVAYFRAQCNRPNVCAGGTPAADPCPTVTDACPDIEFAPGTSRTVASLLDCAQAWASFPCADLAAGKIPDCAAPPGNLPNGVRCVISLQCTSTFCGPGTDAAHPSCGTCAPRAPSGGACTSAGECPREEQCTQNVCTRPAPAPSLGQPCTSGTFCASPNICRPAATGGMTCQPLPRLGEACSGIIVCQDGSLCTAAMMCEAMPSNGMPCKRDAVFNRYTCDNASTCDESAASGPTCRPRTGVGGACAGDPRSIEQGSCAPELACFCADTACTAGVCLQRRQEGDPCGDANGRCVPGTACVAGHCAAMSQDVMTKQCGA